MIDYKIFWDKNRVKLEEEIIGMIKKGYECCGGVSMATTNVTTDKKVEVLAWAQAVIKK